MAVAETETRWHRVRCGCRFVTAAPVAADVPNAPYYGPNRSEAESAGVLPGFRGTMVHDALWLYRGFPEAEHQLYVAHVIRELTACDERFPGQIWAPQIRWTLAELIKLADRCRLQGLDHIPPEQARRWLHY